MNGKPLAPCGRGAQSEGAALAKYPSLCAPLPQGARGEREFPTMPANVYECLFLLDTTKVAGDVPAAAKQLHGILERHKAEILASRIWDDRRLAYPVRNHKKGLYYLTYFKADGKALRPIEQDVA